MKVYKFLLALMFGFSVNALADMYAVYGIHVDVTAENATIAKEQGVADAQEKAFYKVLDRLTLFKDLESLPVLSTEDILNLVRDFSVSHEKTSSVRYIADVDVQFDPDSIKKFFEDNRVPYVTSAAEKSLVFPVYRDVESDEVLLWKDTNPWSKVLLKAAQSSDLVPLVVPLGDVDDMTIINEENWQNKDNLDISPILQRYNCENALATELVVLRQNNVVKVTVFPIQGKDSFFKPITITEPIDAPLPEVLKRTADRLVYVLEQSWREQNAVHFDNPTMIAVDVYIKDLAHWLEMRKQLDKMVLIKQYIVKALRRDKAEIEVFYVGKFDAFENALKKEGLYLSQTAEDKWLLRPLEDMPADELNDLVTENEDMPDKATDNNAETQAEAMAHLPEEQNKAPIIEPVLSEIRTFDVQLYEQVQPETMEMLTQDEG